MLKWKAQLHSHLRHHNHHDTYRRFLGLVQRGTCPFTGRMLGIGYLAGLRSRQTPFQAGDCHFDFYYSFPVCMSYRIGVIGTGYVGLVTGTCLADVGNTVLCIDVDAAKIESLRKGIVPIFEDGLERLLERALREERISFSLDLAEAVRSCSVLMFCLPTPPDKDGAADLAAVLQVSERVAGLLNTLDIREPRIVVNKSTVPVGTADRVAEIFKRVAPDRTVSVVSNPEFLSQGIAVDDFMKPNRVVIGTSDPYAEEVMRNIYEPFVGSDAPILVFDVRSAEIAKYAANAILATKISFMNDLSAYCEVVGADIESVRTSLAVDDRIGRNFLHAGLGYGGSCFPKDVKAIAHAARKAGTPLQSVEATNDVNERQVQRFIDRVSARFDNMLQGRVFALWGLAFKPNTDDVREARSLVIIQRLIAAGATVQAYDPEAIETTREVVGETITYAANPYDAVADADALLIVTEWNEFKRPDWDRVRKNLIRPLIFDGRNIYTLDDMLAEGFEYYSVGRPSVVPLMRPESDD